MTFFNHLEEKINHIWSTNIMEKTYCKKLKHCFLCYPTTELPNLEIWFYSMSAA